MTIRTLAGTSLLACIIAACGGGSDNTSGGTPAATTLAASAGASYALAGGNAVTLSATVSDGSAVNWQLAAGSPGSLSAASGTSVKYQPPPGGVTAATPVTVNATAGGVTKAVNFTLYPDPGTPRLEIIAGDDGSNGVMDGRGTLARFESIHELAIDAAGGLLVAEDAALRRVTADGVVTTLARTAVARTVAPSATGVLAFAEVDYASGAVAIRRLNSDLQATTFATLTLTPRDDFHLHGTVTGKLYGIQNERIATIADNGAVVPLVGTITGADQPAAVDGPAATARFGAIKAAASDQQGNLYVIDGTLIRKVTPAGVVTTLAGNPAGGLPTDGTGAQARFLAPFSLAVDSQGNVLVLDPLSGNTATALRKVTQAGVVTTIKQLPSTARQIVGNGGARVLVSYTAEVDLLNADATSTPFVGKAQRPGEQVNGTGTEARFSVATYLMTADSQGNLFVVDREVVGTHGNDVPGLALRKVTPAGVVTPFVNSSAVHVPTGIVTDAGGNMYVSDRQVAGWGTPQTGGGAIYKVTPQGTVTLLAGSGDQTDTKVDGTGTAARFIVPTLVGIDADGNLYATDRVSVNGTGVGVPVPVRKITPAGVVTTVAAVPADVGAVKDANGNVYTADYGQSVIYRTTPGGEKTVVAGVANQTFNYTGPLPGSLDGPSSLVATGPFSFALLSKGTVLRLVVPH
jgi:hypothetical protein